MKRQVSNSGVAFMLSLLFMLGGLFIANDVQAQAHNLMQVQPVTNWITPQQAIAVASIEVENLTVKIQTLKNNGADTETLQKVKTELHFYAVALDALQNSKGTEESFKLAWSAMGGGSTTGANSPLTGQEAKLFYDKAFGQFTD